MNVPRLAESDRLRPPPELAGDPWYQPSAEPAERPAEATRLPQVAPAEASALVAALVCENAFWSYLVAAWEGRAGTALSPIPNVPD